ncbi:lysophospholipid acyltransferase family protein [Leptospira sp. GIMC2001]|nr:lysophospholipid acyltransferase family protein [Leptospira sp. GIMC2001]WCL51297.1 lysophospholipid acyltransferase family protein [Leptospira sp. GIMC2001]
MDRHLEGQSKAYQFFVARVYLRILPLILTRAFPTLIAGLYNGAVGTKERRINSFLRGSRMWGETVQSMTKAKIHAFNELNIPDKGHLIFSNHVNELDFPFDCYFICKPYLANQVIKKTLFAYWWMKAMGSEVFDNRSNMSIAVSVKNLRKGIKDNSYIVYPEGRNTYSEEIQPLKKGMCKLAFDNKLPIVIILKSGIVSFQEYQKGNTIGYYSCGIVDPTQFSDWDSLRAHVQELMVKGKIELDRLTDELRNQNKEK